MKNRNGHPQRWLDFCLRQPVGATDRMLETALADYNPALTQATRITRLSEMRVCTDKVVRARVASIASWAAQHGEPGTTRYTAAFIRAARVIRRGETLP